MIAQPCAQDIAPALPDPRLHSSIAPQSFIGFALDLIALEVNLARRHEGPPRHANPLPAALVIASNRSIRARVAIRRAKARSLLLKNLAYE